MRPLFFISFLLLLSCNSSSFEYEFWSVDDFTFCDPKIEKLNRIKVLYTSFGEDEHEDAYVHTVAINQETMDTVNILSNSVMRFNTHDADIEFGFMDDKLFPNNEVFEKVYRDPRFDEIADNDFCTFYGQIGTIVSDFEEKMDFDIKQLYKKWTIDLYRHNGVEVGLKEKNFINLRENHCSFKINPLAFEKDFATWRIQAPKHFTLNRKNRQQTFEIVSLTQSKLVLSTEDGTVHIELSSGN